MNKIFYLTILILLIGAVFIIRDTNLTESIGFLSSSTTDTRGTTMEKIDDILEETKAIKKSPINIDYLRGLEYPGSEIKIEEELASGSNYKRYRASYMSDGYKIFGLLTVPNTQAPEGGYPAIVFNHGYIPPTQYVTTEKYIAYVDTLARNEFVVFKIDMRGHGNSEGTASGSYFSPVYMTDALNALASLQKYPDVNPSRIGMWGHSMSGNLTLRAMLVSDEVKAGVIWGGAVYSYEDFAKYRISDNSYRGRPPQDQTDTRVDEQRDNSEEVAKLRENPDDIDFNDPYWTGIALTKNLNNLTSPIQLHHSVNDATVNVGYSRDLVKSFADAGKSDYIELFEYTGGDHNIDSPYFETAMQRTVEFYKANL